MIDVPVLRAMTERTPTVQPDCPIDEAAGILRDPAVPALVVRDSSDEVSGIVTESDVVAAVAEGASTHPVRCCMSSPVVTTQPTTPVGLAADRMRDAGVTILPVVEGDDTVHGLVTRDTLAPYVSRNRLEITWQAEPLTIDAESPEST